MHQGDLDQRSRGKFRLGFLLFALVQLSAVAGACCVVLSLRAALSAPWLVLLGAGLAAACVLLLWLGVGRLLALVGAPDALRAEHLFQEAPDAILLVNARGQLVSLNPSAEEFFGYPTAEVAGQPITQLIADP